MCTIEEIEQEIFADRNEHDAFAATANEASGRCIDAFARQGASLYEGETPRALLTAHDVGCHRISRYF